MYVTSVTTNEWLPDVIRLPQRLKSTVFEKKILTPMVPLGPLRTNFFPKTLILAFEANSALSCQNGLFSMF